MIAGHPENPPDASSPASKVTEAGGANETVSRSAVPRIAVTGISRIDPMHILALDQGTTSSRAILFDREGEIRAVNYAVGITSDGQPIIDHRIEQYFSGKWKTIRVYHEDTELTGGEDD